MNKICFFNRSSVHYRKNIYLLMEKELNVDFYFGNNRPGNIKSVDTSLLHNFKGFLKNLNLGPFYWQKGVLGLLKKDYTHYITPGDTYCLSTWVFLFFAKIRKKNVYLWTHGAYGDEKWLKKWLTKKRMDLCTSAFLYGNYAKQILINYGIQPSKLHVIYNSLDYDEQIKIRKELNHSELYNEHFKNFNKNLVFIGRLTTIKKLDLVIKAVHQLKESGFLCNVTFIGDGPVKSYLQTLSEDLGVSDNVWFYGACYDETLISLFLFNADLCVSPGNVGLTAMHAMTFGTPVLSHDNFPKQMPEFEAIINGKTGCFFQENNVESLALSIKKWISEKTDRTQTREDCYSVIDEKYNPHRQIETMKRIMFQ